MKRFLTLACVAILAGAVALSSVQPAEAHNRRGALVAGLIIGGVTAVILGSQVRAYHQPQYYMYYGQPVRFGHGPVWQQHVSYCYGRYRSYNHHTNLFLAYSGHYRHCRSPYIY